MGGGGTGYNGAGLICAVCAGHFWRTVRVLSHLGLKKGADFDQFRLNLDLYHFCTAVII